MYAVEPFLIENLLMRMGLYFIRFEVSFLREHEDLTHIRILHVAILVHSMACTDVLS